MKKDELIDKYVILSNNLATEARKFNENLTKLRKAKKEMNGTQPQGLLQDLKILQAKVLHEQTLQRMQVVNDILVDLKDM
jgi:hypothetical protein